MNSATRTAIEYYTRTAQKAYCISNEEDDSALVDALERIQPERIAVVVKRTLWRPAYANEAAKY